MQKRNRIKWVALYPQTDIVPVCSAHTPLKQSYDTNSSPRGNATDMEKPGVDHLRRLFGFGCFNEQVQHG